MMFLPLLAAATCLCQPTPAPTAAAPPTTANACAATITNGKPLPRCVSDTFFPATPRGLYRKLLPANPQVDPDSGALIKAYFGATGSASDVISGLMWHNGISQRLYDYSRPLYLAKTTDVLVTINCTTYCQMPSVRAYIPANSLAAGGSDKHLTLLQPSNAFIDMWGFEQSPPYYNGQNLSARTLAETNIDGVVFSSNDVIAAWMKLAPTAGGMVDGSGSISLAALKSGVVNHEVYVVVDCVGNSWQYPASQGARLCIDNRHALENGALLHYKLTDSQIDASSMSYESKVVAHALRDYGGRVSDTGGVSGMGVQLESQEPLWSYGSHAADPFIAYAIAHGWKHVVNASASPPIDRFIDPLTDLNLPAHLEVLAPSR